MEITFTAYDVSECGYFPRGRKEGVTSPDSFYSIDELASDLTSWLKDKALSETKLKYRQHEKDVYCSEIIKSKGNVFVSLWVGADLIHGNRQLSIDPNSIVNAPSITSKSTDGKIPGVPSFFMIPKGLSLIISLRPEGYPSSASAIDAYFYNYIKYKSPRVVLEDEGADDESIKIDGYCDDSGEIVKWLPKFRKVQSTKKAYIDYLKRRRSSIVKVLYKAEIPSVPSKRSKFKKLATGLLAGLGLEYGKNLVSQEIPIHYDVGFTPTDEEFSQIITQYNALDSDKDDIGFKFKSDTDHYWLSRGKVKEVYDINVQFDATGNILLNSIIAEVSRVSKGFITSIT